MRRTALVRTLLALTLAHATLPTPALADKPRLSITIGPGGHFTFFRAPKTHGHHSHGYRTREEAQHHRFHQQMLRLHRHKSSDKTPRTHRN